MFIIESSLPKPRGRGQSSNTANVTKNVSVSLQKVDIESASNSKSMNFSFILHFLYFKILGIIVGNIYSEYFYRIFDSNTCKNLTEIYSGIVLANIY